MISCKISQSGQPGGMHHGLTCRAKAVRYSPRAKSTGAGARLPGSINALPLTCVTVYYSISSLVNEDIDIIYLIR